MADKKEEKDESAVAEVDNELEEEETPYPYYVFFILGNEFCERYAYYGMRSILVIFLVSLLSTTVWSSTSKFTSIFMQIKSKWEAPARYILVDVFRCQK